MTRTSDRPRLRSVPEKLVWRAICRCGRPKRDGRGFPRLSHRLRALVADHVLGEGARLQLTQFDQHLGRPVEGTRVLQHRLDPDARDEVVQPRTLDIGFGTTGQRRFRDRSFDVSLFLGIGLHDQDINIPGFGAAFRMTVGDQPKLPLGLPDLLIGDVRDRPVAEQSDPEALADFQVVPARSFPFLPSGLIRNLLLAEVVGVPLELLDDVEVEVISERH